MGYQPGEGLGKEGKVRRFTCTILHFMLHNSIPNVLLMSYLIDLEIGKSAACRGIQERRKRSAGHVWT